MSVHPGCFSNSHAIEKPLESQFLLLFMIVYMLQSSVIIICMRNLLYLCVYIDFVNDKIVGHTQL